MIEVHRYRDKDNIDGVSDTAAAEELDTATAAKGSGHPRTYSLLIGHILGHHLVRRVWVGVHGPWSHVVVPHLVGIDDHAVRRRGRVHCRVIITGITSLKSKTVNTDEETLRHRKGPAKIGQTSGYSTRISDVGCKGASRRHRTIEYSKTKCDESIVNPTSPHVT